MNAKEMEALIIEQAAMIKALKKNDDDQWTLVQALQKGYEELRAVINVEVVIKMDNNMKLWSTMRDVLTTIEDDLGYSVREPDEPLIWATIIAHRASIEELDTLVKGRNKSAAVKRNMVDADALRVLTGDLAKTPHKEAAEIIGLTYAQVYSCRLEYTFKHVHHELCKDKEYKNDWRK